MIEITKEHMGKIVRTRLKKRWKKWFEKDALDKNIEEFITGTSKPQDQYKDTRRSILTTWLITMWIGLANCVLFGCLSKYTPQVMQSGKTIITWILYIVIAVTTFAILGVIQSAWNIAVSRIFSGNKES